MQINWFTVLAQIINFLILVWLLRRYLYHPILNAIDEREKKIASQLKDAGDKKAEADKEKDEFKKKNDDFDNQKKTMLSKAVSEANEERQKLLEEARSEAKKLGAGLEKASKETMENLNHEIAQKIQEGVFTVARKTLADLASQSLEEQSVNVFMRKLQELKDDEKKKFIDAFKSGLNLVLVRSAFDLSPKLQDEISKAVKEILSAEIQLQFKTAPELISGIEMTSNGYKLAWSISEYLKSLQENIFDTSIKQPVID